MRSTPGPAGLSLLASRSPARVGQHDRDHNGDVMQMHSEVCRGARAPLRITGSPTADWQGMRFNDGKSATSPGVSQEDTRLFFGRSVTLQPAISHTYLE